MGQDRILISTGVDYSQLAVSLEGIQDAPLVVGVQEGRLLDNEPFHFLYWHVSLGYEKEENNLFQEVEIWLQRKQSGLVGVRGGV